MNTFYLIFLLVLAALLAPIVGRVLTNHVASSTSTMARDFSAFQRRMASQGDFGMLLFQRRDEPSVKSVAESIDKINTAFAEYKQANDARLEAIKNGQSTADLDAKLAKMDSAISSLEEQKKQLEDIQKKLARPGVMLDTRKRIDDETQEQAEYRQAFVDWMRRPGDYERQQKATQAMRAMEAKSTEVVTSTPGAGGYALPLVIERAIMRLGLDISPIRSIATVRTVGSPDYKELVDTGGAAFEWVGETDPRNQTNTPNLVEIAPTFGMASAKPQATEESLDDLFFDVEQWLTASAAEAMAKGEGLAFISGDGTKKPTGFLTGTPVATDDLTRAFGVLQYIASGQAAAMPTSSDTFIDMTYAVRARYRANARWVTSKAILGALRKYKTTTGEYLWEPSTAAGQPSTFLGYAITEAEDMPALAANAFPLAFGDFREGYLVVDRVGMRMTRDEITTPGYVKFYIRKRLGGCLRNSQAIKLLKIAAS